MKKRDFVTVSIPSEELEKLREIADSEHRSMASQIAHWIESYNQNKRGIA